jgi:soluble lytic murein transglycosylase-like protein
MSRRLVAALLVCLACAGCGGNSRYASHWDGRRGYDGNGDYGYDLAASQSEARTYASRAARAYPAPGPSDDPWGPYIRGAAQRFQVPERWIREVMRQESSFQQYDHDGSLMTSPTGAMGLMQVMPHTYDILRQRYGLGTDPYEPRDNILAGAAYIREMYDQYGSPAFLAAYNAGPGRLESYLNGGTPLPDETVNYLARIAPRLGTEVAMSGPLAAYAGVSGRAAYARSTPRAGNRAYAGGGMTAPSYSAPLQTASADEDPADRAFDGGGLVTPDAPTGVSTAPTAAPAPTPIRSYAARVSTPAPSTFAHSNDAGADGYYPGTISRASYSPTPAAIEAQPKQTSSALGTARPVPMSPPPSILRQPTVSSPAPRDAMVPRVLPVSEVTTGGGWAIQVGAYPDPANSRSAVASARARAPDLLGGSQPLIMAVQRGGVLYRARLAGLSADRASAACARLSASGMACFAVPPGS